MEETSKHGLLGRHQSCSEERLKFYQTRSNAIILHETLPAYCIPKVVRVETPRPPPKISLKNDWMKELCSEVARQPEGEVARQPEGEVARQAKCFQSTQPNPNPNHDRTGGPVVCSERALRSKEIETRSSREEAENHDRTERPVVCSERASHTRFSRDSTNFNLEEDVNHDRTVRPVVCSDLAPQTRFSGDRKNFNLEEETITIELGDPLCAHNQSVQC